MAERTIGQKVHQWLTNFTVLIPLLSVLGGSAIYGNSTTVKKWVHGSNNSPLTTQAVTPEIEPVNYDRIISELITLNKKQDKRMTNQDTHILILQDQINILKQWHE